MVKLFSMSPRPSKAGVKRAAMPQWCSPFNSKHYLKEALTTHLAYSITLPINDVVSDFSLFDWVVALPIYPKVPLTSCYTMYLFEDFFIAFGFVSDIKIIFLSSSYTKIIKYLLNSPPFPLAVTKVAEIVVCNATYLPLPKTDQCI